MLGDPPLELRCDRHQRGVVVSARGELDIAAAPQLRDILRGPDAQAAIVVLDLRSVEFIDSSGLEVILEHDRRAKTDGFRFSVTIRDSAPSVRRLFEVSGVTDLVELVDAPEALVGDRSPTT